MAFSIYEKYWDAEELLKKYMIKEWTGDSVLQPMNEIKQWFISQAKKVDRCILYGGGYAIHLLFPASDFCKEIVVIDFQESNLQYVRRWLKDDPIAFNWSETFKHVFEREEEREFFIEREKKTRTLINHVIKMDMAEGYPVAPKDVPQADIIISPWTLFFVCQDIDSFTNSVKEMSALLKVGGRLLILLFIECTFIYVNNIKFPVLYCKENTVLQILTDQGYTIKDKQKHPRQTVGKFSTVDFSYLLFIDACKEREVLDQDQDRKT